MRHLLASRAAAAALGLICALSLLPAPALACGGFFCSLAQPVDQSAERILFAVEDEEVTAHIQISYQGPAEEFSWVLPLPAVPEVGVGTEQLFTALHQITDPTFTVDWQPSPSCDLTGACGCDFRSGFGDDSIQAASAPADEDGDGVQVLAEGAVGPYDFKVVAAGDGGALFNWLNENDYDQPDSAAPIIEHYVGLDMVFLALKLQKDAAAGDIRPVTLKYAAPSLACIPLRLTSIAAQPDMPIYAWVLGGARAIPTNFFHAVLNARAYPWLRCARQTGATPLCGVWYEGPGIDCRQAYVDLVTRAADTAGGRAFVTEYAGSTEGARERVYAEGMVNTEGLRETTDAAEFMGGLMAYGYNRRFGADTRALLLQHIPLPVAGEGVPEECTEQRSFYTQWGFDRCRDHMPADWTFDPNALVDGIEERIIKPLQEAQALVDAYPYMTRLFTTLSADEMTRDPFFSFNPDLPDVSNEHRISATMHCASGDPASPFAITLGFGPDDETVVPVSVADRSCGLSLQLEGEVASEAGALAELQLLSATGEPVSVPLNEAADEDARLNDDMPPPVGLPKAPSVRPTASLQDNLGTFGTRPADRQAAVLPPSPISGGCHAGASGSLGGAAWLALCGLAVLLGRRRQRFEA